jgi:hypothetical protein
MRTRLAFAAAATWLMTIGSAGADTIRQVDMTFQSGATFNGSVSFADDLSSVTGVTGTLSGYVYGNVGYFGSGVDPISWVWFPGVNQNTSGSTPFTTFLMDGPPPLDASDPNDPAYSIYSNFIVFSYTSSGSDLAFAFSGSYQDPDNGFYATAVNSGADIVDPFVSGTIGSVAAVPLHPSLSAQMLVLLLLGSFVAWRNRGRAPWKASASAI